MADNRNPTPEEVRLIFRDVYNFYTKWINIENEENWSDLLNDIRDLEKKYPFDLCIKMLLETMNVIERYYMERKCDNG